jgi:type IV secretion system protein VirD4
MLDRAIAKGVVVLLAPLALSVYLAGAFFLASIRLDPRTASPLTIVKYGYYYRDRPEIWRRVVLASGGAGVVVLGGLILILWPRRRSLHGDARFATRAEIAAAGLFSRRGIIIGRYGRRLLRLPGQQGVALAAPPRAGKGTGVVIPNALMWPGSLVCVDIKRENWTITAGARAKSGQKCFLFDPFAEDGRTARWNPFSYVASDPSRRLNDLQRIAEMLYPDPPNVDPFWTASARSLFLGISLYLFETPSLPKTIGEVLRQGMASDNEGFAEHWKRLIAGRNSHERPLSSECVRALCDVIDLAPVTASSIRKTFTSRLDLWLNPILDAATSGNDFNLRELRSKPMSIYVGVNPDDLHRLRPVLNLFFQQAIGLQTRELPEHNRRLKYQVMMLLDEFTALGRIPIMAEAVSYLPGYNVRVVLVIQTPAQLREVYGMHGAEVMLKSLATRIVFAPKDYPDAREISDELGFATVRVRSVSKAASPNFDARASRGRSQTVSEQRRALLLPQEVKEIGKEEAIVFYEGLRPIRCQKVRYFSDWRFRWRVRSAPPVLRSKNEPMTQQTAPMANAKALATPATVPAPAGTASTESPVRIRLATAEDIGYLETMTIEDFADRIPEVAPPDHEGPCSGDELDSRAESWVRGLKQEREKYHGRCVP